MATLQQPASVPPTIMSRRFPTRCFPRFIRTIKACAIWRSYGDRSNRYDDMPPPPRRFYGPPPRYEYMPPPMPPPRYYGPPPASDDRAPYYPNMPSENRGFPDDPR